MTDKQMILELVERMNRIEADQQQDLANSAKQQELLLQTAALGDELRAKVLKLETFIGAGENDGPFYDEFKELREKFEMFGMSLDAQYQQLATTTAKVEGRNSSAPVKRNMTDDDALRVITGDLKDVDHKEAAEKIGLTYAQVYSARLEYTFKHVHKQLRDSKTPNRWVKKV